MLLEKNINPRIKNEPDKKSLLHIAARYGSLCITKYLIDLGVHFGAEDDNHFSVLHDSCRYGNYMVCKFLLEKGADPNAVADNGCSPLHFAAAANQLQICKLLVAAGANPSYVNPLNKLAPFDFTTNNDIKKFIHSQVKKYDK